MDKDLLIDDILKDKAKTEILSLPEDLDFKIKQTIENLSDRKKRKSSFARKAAVAASIGIVAAISLSAAFPAYARNVPVVSSVFEFLSEKNLIDKDYIRYSSELNLSETSNGVTVTINSIVYDGIDLNIGYTVENNKEFKNDPHILDKDFKINGKLTSFGSGGTGQLINKNTYVGVDSFHVANDYLPKDIRKHIVGGDVKILDNFIMDLNIRQFSDGTSGHWNFKFKVSIDKIKGKVQEVKTNIELSDIKPSLKVNEVIFTPINTVIRTSENNIGSENTIRFFVFDDKGRKLSGKAGSGSGNQNLFYLEQTFQNIYEDTKAVTFIPAVNTKEYEEKRKNSNGSWELDQKGVQLNLSGSTVLSEGRYGEYKISQIEFFTDKTIIHYECIGLLPAMQPYGLSIKDDTGKGYRLGLEKIKDLGDNNFTAEIEPLSKERKYQLIAVDLEKEYDVREDLKFTIQVK